MNHLFLKIICVVVTAYLFVVGIRAQPVLGSCDAEVKTIVVNSGSIQYLSVGNGSPILLLHGLFAQKEQWTEMACYLSASGYLVIAPDLPGYGMSVNFPIEDYGLEKQVEILHQFTQSLGVEKFDIAGSSMGGAIASMYSKAYPGQIKSLAFIGAPMGFSAWGAGVKAAFYRGINPFIPISNEEFNLAMQLLFYKRPVVPESIQRDLIADYQKSNRHYQQVWDIVNLYLYGMEKIPPGSIPTLLLWGEEDRIFEVDGIRKAQQKFPKNQHFIIKEAGHLLMLETPKEVTAIYIQFLKSR